MMISEVLIPAVIFFAAFHIVRILSEHFLKRKIIKSGHFEKAEILTQIKNESEEVNKYPSLKWALVAFMAGAGFILIEVLRSNDQILIDQRDALLPIGIELVFISLGFLIYFFYVNFKSK